MNVSEKKRAVVSYENMSEELAAEFKMKYPKGFNDFLPDLVKYDKPDGSCFYAITLEITSAIYLIKIKIKTDDIDDLERWLDGESDDDGDDSDEMPDDNIGQFVSDDDSSSDLD